MINYFIIHIILSDRKLTRSRLELSGRVIPSTKSQKGKSTARSPGGLGLGLLYSRGSWPFPLIAAGPCGQYCGSSHNSGFSTSCVHYPKGLGVLREALFCLSSLMSLLRLINKDKWHIGWRWGAGDRGAVILTEHTSPLKQPL